MTLDTEHDPLHEDVDPASPDSDAHAPLVDVDDEEITVELLPPTIPNGIPSPLGDEDDVIERR